LYIELRTGTTIEGGTLLATSEDLAGSSLTASFAEYDFDFLTPPTLSTATDYHFVIMRDGSASESDYYQANIKSTGGYANGDLYYYNNPSGPWTVDTSDFWFKILEVMTVGDNKLQVYYSNLNQFQQTTHQQPIHQSHYMAWIA